MKNIFTKKKSKGDKNFELVTEEAKKVIQKHGFGILYSIDFGEMSVSKRDISIGDYIQLWICHAGIWFPLLDQDKSFGALLPCPLCIYEEWDHIVYALVNSDAQLWLHPSYTSSVLTQKAGCVVRELFDDL